MRLLILSVYTGAVLLASGCMFLSGYDFDQYHPDSASTSAAAAVTSGSSTSSSTGGMGGAGGAETSASSGTSTSSGSGPPPPQPVVSDIPAGTRAFAADDSKVYWVTKSDSTVDNAMLVQVDESGGSAEGKLTMLSSAPAIAVGSNHIAWIENPIAGKSQRAMWSNTPLGAPMEMQATALNDHPGLGVTIFGGHIYATTASEVWRAPFGSTMSDGPVNHGNLSPLGPIVADSLRVYWLDNTGVRSVTLAGVSTNEMPFTHSTLMDSPMTGVGVYNGDVYWTTEAGEVFKCLKDQSCNSVNPQPYNRYPGKVGLTGILIDNAVAYASTATSVIALNLSLTGKPDIDGPRTILDGRKKIVALFKNGTAIFVADEDPSSKKITVYRTPKVM